MKKRVDVLIRKVRIADMSDETIKKLVGKRIAEARGGVHLNQDDLATACNVSKSAVGQWERGESFPRIERLVCIAELTRQPVYWFFSGRILSQEGEVLSEEEENLVTGFRGLTDEQAKKVYNFVMKLALASKERREHDLPTDPNRGGT